MPQTTNYDLRYPSLSDPPNVPLDVQNLAEDTEDALGIVATAVSDEAATPRALGIVGRNRRLTPFSTNATGAATRAMSTIATVVTGRTYRVWSQFEISAAASPALVQFELRYTTNNSEPATSSTLLGRTLVPIMTPPVGNDTPVGVHLDVLYVAASSHTFRVALVVNGLGDDVTIGGGGDATPCDLVIEDVGPTVSETGTDYTTNPA